MYVLLLICNALCPQPLDESLEKPIREKHSGILGMIWNRREKQKTCLKIFVARLVEDLCSPVESISFFGKDTKLGKLEIRMKV